LKLKERHASRIKPRAFNESLAIFIPNFAPGGAERVNVNLANSFAARGYEVDMVLMSATGPLQESLSTAIHQVDLHSPRVRAVLWPLVRYLRASKPDVLLANMWPLTVLAVLAKFIAGVHTRVVVAEHCTWSRSELLTKPIVAWQIRTSMHYVFPRSDAIVTVSQGAAHDLARFARLDRKSIKVIYNH
jgi:glycosyltransferase involved in cell wall biosynthesis